MFTEDMWQEGQYWGGDIKGVLTGGEVGDGALIIVMVGDGTLADEATGNEALVGGVVGDGV